MVINQGDVYWAELGEPSGSGPGYQHPHVVIQNNLFNASRINTVITCVVTSNMRLARSPNNIALEKGEANLPKPSVVLVSQVVTLDKLEPGEYIGTLSRQRVNQILAGVQMMFKPSNLDRQ